MWTHESIGYPKMDHQPLGRGNSLWHSACPILWSNPIRVTLFHGDPHRYFVYSLALGLRNTKVPVWTYESIGYPKMDISLWDAAIHYGVQLAQYCDQTRFCYAISRRLPPLCSLALRLRNIKVPVWTHESIGYPKMDISHLGRGNSLWRAAYPILWSNPFGLRYFTEIVHLCAPLPWDSGTPKYLCGLMSP